jgi:hypothetical protein
LGTTVETCPSTFNEVIFVAAKVEKKFISSTLLCSDVGIQITNRQNVDKK